jgi:hypothetical protein
MKIRNITPQCHRMADTCGVEISTENIRLLVIVFGYN